MAKIEKVLVSEEGRFYYVRSLEQDVHTKEGFLRKEQVAEAKNGQSLTSNTNTRFFVFEPSLIDAYAKIARGPQIIPMKDLGFIAIETGMNKESIVLDSGTGSGAAACFFATIAKEVFSYELREDFLEIAQKNVERMGLSNVTIKNRNVYEGIDETDIDIILFDLPEPWNAIAPAKQALKVGGFLVAYSPTMPQVQDFVAELRKHEQFIIIKIVEISEREWEVKDRKVRPKSQGIGHSGFMVFARKVGA